MRRPSSASEETAAWMILLEMSCAESSASTLRCKYEPETARSCASASMNSRTESYPKLRQVRTMVGMDTPASCSTVAATAARGSASTARCASGRLSSRWRNCVSNPGWGAGWTTGMGSGMLCMRFSGLRTVY